MFVFKLMFYGVSVDVLLCVNADVRCLRRGERTINGIFMSCDNCRKYVDARSDNETWLSCRDVQGWGFNAETRQCQFQSPHCYPCDGRQFNMHHCVRVRACVRECVRACVRACVYLVRTCFGNMHYAPKLMLILMQTHFKMFIYVCI